MSSKTLTKGKGRRNGRQWSGAKAGNGKRRQARAGRQAMEGRQAGNGCRKTPKIPQRAKETTPPPSKKKSFSVAGPLT